MYGNNFEGPFISTNIPYGPMIQGIPNTPTLRSLGSIGGPIGQNGLRSSLINSATRRGLLSGIRSINWSNMLGNTSKALGVVKEAIPIVKEVGPMVNNMKSMLKIASIFKDETDLNLNKETKKEPIEDSITVTDINNNQIADNKIKDNAIVTKINQNEPNFFL